MSFCTAIPIPSCGLRYAADADGTIYSLVRPGAPKAMTPTVCADGYARVQIHFTNGTKKMMAVHRLVAEVHCANPQNLPEVNHIDGQKLRNSAVNLEWVDRRANIAHAVRTGLHRGNAPHAKANAHSVQAGREQGKTLQEIAADLGCSLSTAHRYAKDSAE
jgi:hypothetical protein